jgi:hypothetical protein
MGTVLNLRDEAMRELISSFGPSTWDGTNVVFGLEHPRPDGARRRRC